MSEARKSFKFEHAEAKTPDERLAYNLERAEAGHPSYQYFASQSICASDDFPDRRVEALKWLFIAGVLDEVSAPVEVRHYLSSCMTEEEVDRAVALAAAWFAEKARTDIPQDDSLWSQELRRAVRSRKASTHDSSPSALDMFLGMQK